MNTAARKNRQGHRRGWTSYVLGAVAAAALLASAACGSDDDGGSDDAKASDRPSASSPAEPGGTASAEPDGTAPAESDGGSDDTGGSEAEGSGEDGGGNGAVAACAADALAVSATKEPADGKDARHLLITVQNAGDETCDVHRYPQVRIGDAQAPAPVIEDSDPDPGKPVTLAPGEEAYAALLVAGGGRDEYEADAVSLTLQGSEPGSEAGGPVDVPLPVDTLYADDGQLVTYWTTASGSALDFIMSK